MLLVQRVQETGRAHKGLVEGLRAVAIDRKAVVGDTLGPWCSSREIRDSRQLQLQSLRPRRWLNRLKRSLINERGREIHVVDGCLAL